MSRPAPLSSVSRALQAGEEGYLLVGLIVAIFLIMLTLSVAAPTIAKDLKRDRELETAHRANQYVRAIQLYYRKFGHYPGSIDQLKETNNQKFLRQEYLNPFTGKSDWKLIHVGEAKTTVKGFFGQPLAGLPTAGLGSAAGMSSGIGGSSSTSSSSAFGSPGTSPGSSTGTSSFGSPSTNGPGGSSAFGGTGTTDPTAAGGSAAGGAAAGGAASGVSSQNATDFKGTGAPIMGVGLMQSGNSILIVNEQTTYDTWEFIYDPRIEQLKAKANLLGGGPPSTGLGGLGTASGMGSTTGGSSTPPGANGGTNSGPTTGAPSGTPTTP